MYAHIHIHTHQAGSIQFGKKSLSSLNMIPATIPSFASKFGIETGFEMIFWARSVNHMQTTKSKTVKGENTSAF